MNLAAEAGHAAAIDSASFGRVPLRYLFHLRNLAIVGVSLGVLLAARVYLVAVPVTDLYIGVGALVVFNLYTWHRLRLPRSVSDAEFFRQLVVDLFVLTYLFYFTDGAHNPFEGMFLVPLTIAAAYLDWRYTLSILAITMGCYTLLSFQDLPVVMADGGPIPKSLSETAVYLNYLITAGLIAFFVARIAGTVRAHAAALARAREQQLNDHFIVGFGALAAGAAHELATPLSVMAVLVKELKAGRGDLRESLGVMGSQIEACKETLRQLSEAATQSRLEARTGMPADRFLESGGEKFRLLRPGAILKVQWDGPKPGPQVHSDPSLTQALVSLLNNAADASPQTVELRGYLYGDSLRVEVADRGRGIPSEIAQRIGSPFVSSKSPGGGMGLGLFLTDSTVSRLGGTLSVQERPGGGTLVEVSVPLAVLRAD